MYNLYFLYYRQLESNNLSYLPAQILDYIPKIQQLKITQNPWHCDCAAAYLAMWIRTKYLMQSNLSKDKLNSTNFWDFGVGVICQSPGSFGGKLLIHITVHELCVGQWASMKGLVPRLPIEPPATQTPFLMVKLDE